MLGLPGCSVRNIHSNDSIKDISSYDEARKEISNGMTMDEVRARWGEPAAKTSQNNQTIWHYAYVVSNFNPLVAAMVIYQDAGESKTITVTFDKSGRVSDLNFSSQTVR